MAANWAIYEMKLKINGNTERERHINAVVDSINNNFSHSPSYKEVEINGYTTGVHILENNDDIKNIVMKPNDILSTGSIIEWDNTKWLCTSAEMYSNVYYKGTIKKSIHSLTLHKNGILLEVPIAVESGVRLYSQGQKENKYFPTLENELIIYAPNNKNTESIREDNVFRIGKNNYKVMSVQDVLIDGLLVIKVETTTEEPESPPISPTPQEIVIVGSSSIIKGKTSEYTVNYSEPVIWSIDGDFASIVNYDDNSCIVKASSNLGNVRLWAKYGDVEGYKDIAIEGYF